MPEVDEEIQNDRMEKNSKKEKNDPKEAGKSFIGRLLPKLIIVAVVGIFAGAGFTLGRLFADSFEHSNIEGSENAQTSDSESKSPKGSKESMEEGWYYHLEPVIANLNVSDVTRYVKASLILEVSSEMDEKKGRPFLDERKPILTSWLTVYLASLGIEDIRGDANLKRIQSQVLDAFNEKLFPDSKPKIKHILFNEFAVQ